MRIQHFLKMQIVALICSLFCISASAASAASAAEMITVHSGNLKVTPGSYKIAPYAGEQSAWLHLQPKGQGSEMLLDLTTGLLLSRPPDDFKNAGRLGTVSQEDFGKLELKNRLAYLEKLGCKKHNQGCTVLEDDYRLIFISFSSVDLNLSWEVFDARPLMRMVREVFTGRRKATEMLLTDIDKELIEYAATHTKLREQLVDDIESIDSLENLENFQESRRLLGLCTWKSFTCADRSGASIDLRRAEEKQLIRLYSRLLSQKYIEKSNQETGRSIVQFLLKITAPPFPAGDSVSYAVDEIRKLPIEQRSKVGAYLSMYSGPDKLIVNCFADWIQDRTCASILANHDQRSTPILNITPPSESTTAQRDLTARSNTGNGRPQRGTTSNATAIPEEYLGILNYPNPTRLLSINETSGILARDNTTIGGVVFTARSLGKISDGRFEISAKVAEGGEVPIRVGSYRVKLDLNLIYLREDTCVRSIRCFFANDSRVSKSENREAVFNLSPDNGWRGTFTVSFGHLLPLTEDGGSLYKSELREVRLAVKKSVWNLR